MRSIDTRFFVDTEPCFTGINLVPFCVHYGTSYCVTVCMGLNQRYTAAAKVVYGLIANLHRNLICYKRKRIKFNLYEHPEWDAGVGGREIK